MGLKASTAGANTISIPHLHYLPVSKPAHPFKLVLMSCTDCSDSCNLQPNPDIAGRGVRTDVFRLFFLIHEKPLGHNRLPSQQRTGMDFCDYATSIVVSR